MIDTSERSTNSQPDLNLIVQLHIAEYQALTNRNTYLVTLHYALGPIVVGAFILLSETWPHMPHGLVIWAAALVYQGVMIVFLGILYDLFNNIRYMETELGPKVRTLLQHWEVWRYERYMIPRTEYPPHMGYLPALQCVGALLLAAWFRRDSWSRLDWLGVALSLFAIIRSFQLARNAIQEHKDFRKAAAEDLKKE